MRTYEELERAYQRALGDGARAVYDLGRADAEKEATDALAAEKAAHEKTLECLQRSRADWLTITQAAGMLSTDEARHVARAIVQTQLDLAACEERARYVVLYARDHQGEPWARDVLAALGQPVAEREGEAQKNAPGRAFTSTWCPQCGPGVRVDEDGCCTCGCTATGEGADAAAELHVDRCLERIGQAPPPAPLTPAAVRAIVVEVVAGAAEHVDNTPCTATGELARALRQGTL